MVNIQEDGFRMPYTYLHGKLESDFGIDLFSVSEKIPNEEGVSMLHYNNKPCLLYRWTNSFGQMTGLAVYSDDIESIQYATKLYSDKVDTF